ncbi:hypothetical protein [Rhizobium sp. BK251]|uniref:hypothetical protein n=1 Tax=Rhizobium sp. BK251 TaxID=2512125 RepID=UPI001045D64C|nr:hypothetical protein [Rhizobium sp. BK251]TCL70596.1 hypothetical protein EV286_107473 [Rhizobium sp. BK251]
MSRRPSIARFKCGHPGCEEYARYEADNRQHYIDLDRRYGNGQYRCVRHSQPDSVLSLDNIKIVDEMTVFEQPHGLYWGKESASSGFAHGPGFKAFATDFPPGTRLRVTAEVILPDGEKAMEGRE